MDEVFTLSVGIDCGSQIHQVCVLNTSQAVVGERRVAHTGADIQALADWLLTLGETDPSRILVAIEVPRGPIVEALLERGFRVWAINPKQLDRFRERGTAAGAKDDQRDAWVLARAVQTDRYAFRALARHPVAGRPGARDQSQWNTPRRGDALCLQRAVAYSLLPLGACRGPNRRAGTPSLHDPSSGRPCASPRSSRCR